MVISSTKTMLQIFWDTSGYFFWLLVVSAFVLVLERLHPWRRNQRLLRKQFGQDLFWLFFNGHYAGIFVAHLGAFVFAWAFPLFERLGNLQLMSSQPLWAQFIVFLLFRDFLEWCIHNLLHRVPWLWEFHKLHHTIEELDWIGNFRFHWMEIIVYQGLTYLPLVALGVDGRVILWIAVLSTLVGHFNHSNLNLTWGPLRYLINSPRMHVWHHDYGWPADRSHGVNFGVVFSLWDWLFGTAWWPPPVAAPSQQPARLGFPGMERFPRDLLSRVVYPLSMLWHRR